MLNLNNLTSSRLHRKRILIWLLLNKEAYQAQDPYKWPNPHKRIMFIN